MSRNMASGKPVRKLASALPVWEELVILPVVCCAKTKSPAGKKYQLELVRIMGHPTTNAEAVPAKDPAYFVR